MVTAQRPLPDLDRADTQPYWEATRRHRLVLPRCQDCQGWIWYPQTVCHFCNSWNLAWEPVAGNGTIYSFVVVRHGLHPWFANRLPFTTALVELDDAPSVRLTAEIVECAPEDVFIGMNVEVCFEDVDDRVTLPQFRPASRAAPDP
jgi:uncharacterized OB-fold protein